MFGKLMFLLAFVFLLFATRRYIEFRIQEKVDEAMMRPAMLEEVRQVEYETPEIPQVEGKG